MTKIAFLGLGAMGSRMAANLLKAGHAVKVWNRSPGRHEALVAAGALIAESPREAAIESEMIISMVRDDDASTAVWLDRNEGALAGMAETALAIDCSTISVEHARALGHAFADQQRRLVEAPLAGSRPQADAAELIFFAAGDKTAIDAAEPVLSSMGSVVGPVGAHGAGAAVKLMVNASLGVQFALMGELIGLVQRAGVDAGTALDALATTSVCSPAMKAASVAMLQDSFPPSFPIDLVSKDFRLLSKSAIACGANAPVCAAAGVVYENGLENGLGEDNITGIVQLYR